VQLHDRPKKVVFYDGKESREVIRPEEEGFQLENREFIDALLEGRPPVINARDGIQATCIVLAADAAIQTGQVQKL